MPGAPISLTANLEGDGTASVSWAAPESNGGVLLSGYRIQWQSVDAEEGVTPQTKQVYFDDYSDEARPTEVSESVDGLTDGVEYAVRVLAYNPNGDGTTAEVTVGEAAGPALASAMVSGTVLTLTFDKALKESPEPAASAFAVTVDDVARTVTDVTVAGSTLTLTLESAVAPDETVMVSYTVPARDDAGRIEDTSGGDAAGFSGEAVTNDTPDPNVAPTGLPTITGVPQVGETLTADTSAIADEDGLTNVSYRYQWIWNDNGADTDMAGETSTTYTLVTGRRRQGHQGQRLLHRRPEQRRGPDQRGDSGSSRHGTHTASEPDRGGRRRNPGA